MSSANAFTNEQRDVVVVVEEQQPTSMFSSFASTLSSFFPTVHADEEKDGDDDKEEDKEEGGDDKEDDEEEEEDDEPEDPYPAIVEECEKSKECAPLQKHFRECQERVEAGNGFKGEDCLEEYWHAIHCAAECAAPKLFKKLV